MKHSQLEMQRSQLDVMSIEQLWNLHEDVATELTRKMKLEKLKLEERLRKVSSVSHLVSGDVKRERRPYPKVLAKYRNPKNPRETWAGRGKQPRWLASQLRSGKKLDQFLIRRSS
jgi:DNA-binding protein H-NS